jgi:hypothetical protein
MIKETQSPDYAHLLPEDFDAQSRVWIYQSNRLFTMGEALQLEEFIEQFISDWKSHGSKVKGFGTLFFGQFIILMADETASGVSGCSTDSSVRFIQQLEKTFQIQLLDRQLLAFWHNGKVETLPLSQIPYALSNQFLTPDTLYFNNLVDHKATLLIEWIIPIKDSWLKRYL